MGIEALAKPIFVRAQPFYGSAPRTLLWPARPMPGRHAPCPPRAARNGRKKSRSPSGDCGFFIQAWVGIEPTVKLLQSHALPLGYHAVNKVLLSEKIFAIASFFIPFPEDGGNTRTST